MALLAVAVALAVAPEDEVHVRGRDAAGRHRGFGLGAGFLAGRGAGELHGRADAAEGRGGALHALHAVDFFRDLAGLPREERVEGGADVAREGGGIAGVALHESGSGLLEP